MKRLLLAMAITLVMPFGAARAADPAVAEVEGWLNGVRSMKARFTQMAPAGEVTHGTFYLKRPGRLRFEYDPPLRDYIVADGHFVYYWNDALQQQSNAPIGTTIADFLLRDKLSLSGDVLVKDVLREPGNPEKLHISLAQADDMEQGSLTLVFTLNPMKLLRWDVVDPMGQVTQVFLDDVELNVSLPSDLFYFISPKRGDIR